MIVAGFDGVIAGAVGYVSASVFAQQSSPIMEVALAMYLRMGVRRLRKAALTCGVDYDVYLLSLVGIKQSPDPASYKLRVE